MLTNTLFNQHKPPSYLQQKNSFLSYNSQGRPYYTIDGDQSTVATRQHIISSQKINSINQDKSQHQYKTLVPNMQLDSQYTYYQTNRPHYIQKETYVQKENIPPNIELKKMVELPSKSATNSTSNFSKDEILSKIKKVNQLRQKSQQSVEPLCSQKKQIPKEVIETLHQRYRSTTSQGKPINLGDVKPTFQQLLQKTSTNTSRKENNPIMERYGKKNEIIIEETSPFLEFKQTGPSDKIKKTSEHFQTILSDAIKYTRGTNNAANNNSIISNTSQNRSRIKESLFVQLQDQHLSQNRSNLKPNEFLSKICNIASSQVNEKIISQQTSSRVNNDFQSQMAGYFSQPQHMQRPREQRSQTNKSHITVGDVKANLDIMCQLSQQQLSLMNETRKVLAPVQKKNQTRCVSADLVIKPRNLDKKNIFNEIIKNQKEDDKQIESTTQRRRMKANIMTDDDFGVLNKDLDLICEEEVKLDSSEGEIYQSTIKVQHSTEDIHQEKEGIGNYNPDTLRNLVLQEREYMTDPHYLEKKQVNITWYMRAILIDWMMEVSCEFYLKRETFHLSVCYVDQYLSKSPEVLKLKLQLVGLACLFMAAKIEEIYPRKVSDFAKAANFGYPEDQILEMELNILLVTKWRINPPTVNLWLNWYMDQWDIFIEQEASKYHQTTQNKTIQFKKPLEDSYLQYCKLTQLIDCSLLEIQSLQYPPRTLVASFMYLVLSYAYEVFSIQDLGQIKQSSLFLLDQSNVYNRLFSGFVSHSFGFTLLELLPAIQYASSYFNLEINIEPPPGVKTLANTPQESHMEEFLSFQTHSKDLLIYTKNRERVDQ